MRSDGQLLAGIVGLSVFLASAVAAAAPAAGDEAKARALFDKATPLAERGDVAASCPLFIEAHRLFPTGGTAMQVARCYEIDGKEAEALAVYESVLAVPSAKANAERYAVAQQHADALRKRLDAAKAPPPPVVVAAPPPPPPPPPPAAGSRVPAYVAFGVGAAGIVVGTTFGVMALSDMGDVKDACQNNVCPTSKQSEHDGAVTKGWVSTISFGLAIAAVGTGVVLLVTSGKKPDAEPPKSASAVRFDPWRGRVTF